MDIIQCSDAVILQEKAKLLEFANGSPKFWRRLYFRTFLMKDIRDELEKSDNFSIQTIKPLFLGNTFVPNTNMLLVMHRFWLYFNLHTYTWVYLDYRVLMELMDCYQVSLGESKRKIFFRYSLDIMEDDGNKYMAKTLLEALLLQNKIVLEDM